MGSVSTDVEIRLGLDGKGRGRETRENKVARRGSRIKVEYECIRGIVSGG